MPARISTNERELPIGNILDELRAKGYLNNVDLIEQVLWECEVDTASIVSEYDFKIDHVFGTARDNELPSFFIYAISSKKYNVKNIVLCENIQQVPKDLRSIGADFKRLLMHIFNLKNRSE